MVFKQKLFWARFSRYFLIIFSSLLLILSGPGIFLGASWDKGAKVASALNIGECGSDGRMFLGGDEADSWNWIDCDPGFVGGDPTQGGGNQGGSQGGQQGGDQGGVQAPVQVPAPSCTDDFAYNQCVACNESEPVYINNCSGAFSTGPRQYDAACAHWCEAAPPPAPPAPPPPAPPAPPPAAPPAAPPVINIPPPVVNVPPPQVVVQPAAPAPPPLIVPVSNDTSQSQSSSQNQAQFNDQTQSNNQNTEVTTGEVNVNNQTEVTTGGVSVNNQNNNSNVVSAVAAPAGAPAAPRPGAPAAPPPSAPQQPVQQPTTVQVVRGVEQPRVVKIAGVSAAAPVSELPKTGLPALAWAAGAFLPLSSRLRRFGSIAGKKTQSTQFLWEERNFRKDIEI